MTDQQSFNQSSNERLSQLSAVNWVEGNRVVDIPTEPFKGQLLINGKWQASSDGSQLSRVSPAYDLVVAEYAKASVVDAEAAIQAARHAFDQGSWSTISGAERAKLLNQVADQMMARQQELAVLEVLESGKPIRQARDEVAWAAELWRYAAVSARSLHGDSHNQLGQDMLAMVLREPIGVVSIITPWNFPLLIVSQKLPFALAAGCTCVVKPSELTSATTLVLGEILQAVGLPAGVVNMVVGEGPEIGPTLTTHPMVDMVSFTGSTGVGKAISAAAAGTLKKVSLELGGKNPQIIFPDCDWEAAVDAVVFGIYFNAGECCNSGSRILVHESIADAFTKAVIAKSRQVPVGDPLCEATKVGAIISADHLQKVTDYVQGAEQAGATVSLGGQTQGTGGFYMAPTVLTDVTPEMAVANEEIFGPVLSVLTFSDLEEAIETANNCLFGLSAGVWSANIDNCLAIGRRVKAGTVWLNTWMSGYPELPFGGYKESGQGRELGKYGIEEFTELKTIQMHMGPRTSWWLPR
ncbi:aldehyde dehydrogenase family protein [Endozoicomonas sp. SM1973]|uniref:Aldehyde dehydrogenase family protein n=1 Tax=Spartinivicinus marinus TaxID=2994442 RepID=A0A853I5H0_9GAMM|nr:aldehyde dehydrogenase family protein [Spartinivicinus marinus]MCX4029929.1 aldehyde dehydrogenase family protein [Spartinivicinus marinus]NYZ64827.1 aldehyde dehydrogenase family protein [Spartinivicinus marinus]